MTKNRKNDNLGAVARDLDSKDPLAAMRRRFTLPKRNGKTLTYLCGHSLGPMPKAAPKFIESELHAWAKHGVSAHFEAEYSWFDYHKRLCEPLARLAGARRSEIVAMNSLTVNLHLMLASLYRPSGRRRKILIEDSAFPSDQYAVASQLQQHGLDPSDSLVTLTASNPRLGITPEDLQRTLYQHRNQIAVILLPGVQYLTGQVLDMKNCTAVAHKNGCIIGFDLAHAIGNVPLRLHNWHADFAIWCSYKYLNGGPGAIGGCFIHERHGLRTDLPRLSGWWGHDEKRRFKMEPDFSAIAGAEGWQLSNPSIFAMAPLRASLSIFDEAGMRELRTKSKLLTLFMEKTLMKACGNAITITTPKNKAARGSQLSLRINSSQINTKVVAVALHEKSVVADEREPNILRFSAAPLYTRFRDVLMATNALAKVLNG